MTDAIFSKSVKAGGKMYFFDVKQAQGGKQSKYIRVTETWLDKDKLPKRSSITIFPDQAETFSRTFDEVREKVN